MIRVPSSFRGIDGDCEIAEMGYILKCTVFPYGKTGS